MRAGLQAGAAPKGDSLHACSTKGGQPARVQQLRRCQLGPLSCSMGGGLMLPPSVLLVHTCLPAPACPAPPHPARLPPHTLCTLYSAHRLNTPTPPPPLAACCSYIEVPHNKSGTEVKLVVRGKKNDAVVGGGRGGALGGLLCKVAADTLGRQRTCSAAQLPGAMPAGGVHASCRSPSAAMPTCGPSTAPHTPCLHVFVGSPQVTKMPFVKTTYYKG